MYPLSIAFPHHSLCLVASPISVLGPILFILVITDLGTVLVSTRQYSNCLPITSNYTPLFRTVIRIPQSKSSFIWFLLGLLLGSFQLTTPNHNTFILVLSHISVLTKVVAAKSLINNSKPNYHAHISTISNKGNPWACIILCSFYSRKLTLLRRAFITFVFLILEYASHTWNPFTHKSVKDLEHVHRHFTSRIPALKRLSYSERLAFLNLDSLKIRRLKSDLILYYKIFNNLVCINSCDHFSVFTLSLNTRYSGVRLVSSISRTLLITFSRDASVYGTLYHQTSPSLSTFKRNLNLFELSIFFSLVIFINIPFYDMFLIAWYICISMCLFACACVCWCVYVCV